ncbi:hypothetical protein RVW00_000773 [Enterobacter bugandensis]|nr:hypothetical protein [Enterobacter bugandensis]
MIQRYLPLAAAGTIAMLVVMQINSRADLKIAQTDNQILTRETAQQSGVIATQTLNFNRLNRVAEHTSQLNSLVGAATEKTVIEYREILRREKTCDLPVPADVADGLLRYAKDLRSRALRADTGGFNEADHRTDATDTLTYCQAVEWITPILAEIEKANNSFAGIREIEKTRASK